MPEAPSTKRVLVDRANTKVVIIAGIAAFIFVFCLVATKTLVGQSNYQNRVISAKRATLSRLKSDITAANQLESSYQAFTTTSQNVIGGDPNGNGPQDGNNTKIVLDALPSAYDFPAMVTSLETILDSQPITTNSITGTDDEASQVSNTSSATPTPVAMPFELSVSGDYSGDQALITQLEHSIRPIQIQTMQLTGSQDKLSLSITAQTYYQPAKSLNITTKVVK